MKEHPLIDLAVIEQAQAPTVDTRDFTTTKAPELPEVFTQGYVATSEGSSSVNFEHLQVEANQEQQLAGSL